VTLGAAIWFIGSIALGIRIYRKYGIVPKREHLRDPRGTPYAAFWNFFSRDKWTDEGVAFNKRYARECGIYAATMLVAAVLISIAGW
jgi:hypothetical protein